MKKQCVVIRFSGKTIYVAQVVDLESKDIFELTQVANDNLNQIINKESSTKTALLERIKNLEKEIKILKGEE